MASKSLAHKMRERALHVSPEQVATFAHDHVDLLTAEAILAGNTTLKALAEYTEVSPTAIKHRLLDPIRAAWISNRVDELVSTRLGQVMGALFSRAVTTGDPAASKLLLKQYGKMVGDGPKRSVNVNVQLDLAKMTPEQLEKYIEDVDRELGREVIDVEAEVKDEQRDEC